MPSVKRDREKKETDRLVLNSFLTSVALQFLTKMNDDDDDLIS